MNVLINPRDFVGKGIYSMSDAATLLIARPRTIRRWMTGYDYKQDGERCEVSPLWCPDLPQADGDDELSFRDLIELRFVRAFMEMGLGLKAIRNCLDHARECIDSDRPFSSGRFQTDGRTIFLESLDQSNDPKLLDLRSKQYVFRTVIQQTFKDLDLEDDIVTRWRPFHGKPSIVIDPHRSFGQPIAAEFGVPTVVLAEAVEAEGSVARTAALFEVTLQVVRDAVKFHKGLAAP
jgi:uncharacterized protein (DUF433 family)